MENIAASSDTGQASEGATSIAQSYTGTKQQEQKWKK